MDATPDDDVQALRGDLGEEVRRLRHAAGLTQEALARRVGYHRVSIAQIEAGRQDVSEERVRRLDRALSAEGVLLARHHRLAAEARRARSGAGLAGGEHGLDTPLEIAERIQWVSASCVDDVVLMQLDQMVGDVIAAYERTGPAPLAPQVARQRRWVDRLLRERQHPEQRQHLYLVAAQLSGVLATLALDLGQPATARAYAVKAFQLAGFVRRADVQAWVRGTQSLIEYYAGQYRQARDHARDGQALAGGGTQSVRLAVNGEARALARLGDVRGVDEAVDRAFMSLTDTPPVETLSVSLTLGPYCAARTEGNAATAYLWLGQLDRAREHAEHALPAFDAAGLRGPSALTRLDIAISLILEPGRAEPDRAAVLARDALRIAATQRFRSVAQRAGEFLDLARPWKDQPGMREVAELAQGA